MRVQRESSKASVALGCFVAAFSVTCRPSLALAEGPSSPAHTVAAPHAFDAIYLGDGGALRGTIIAAIPSAQVRIELATGENATVPLPLISRVVKAETARRNSASIDAPGASSVGALANGTAIVHVESPDSVDLEHDTTGHDDYETVCTSPCDRALSINMRYRVAGHGVRPSAAFSLANGGHDTITVSPASQGTFVGGLVLLPVSGLAMFVGLTVGLASTLLKATFASHSSATAESTGYAVTLAGLGGVIGGIVLIVANRHSHIAQSTSGAATRNRQLDPLPPRAVPAREVAKAKDTIPGPNVVQLVIAPFDPT